LAYLLTHGPHEKGIALQAYRAGQPLPDAIENAPELMPGLGLYLQAFFDLDSDRSHAMGPTAIPFRSILDYARAFNFDDEQTEDLIYYIKQMDSDHLQRIATKQRLNSGNAT